MLFGLCNALATFQKLMDTDLRGLVGSECLVYLDDVIVFGKTAEEHTARLCEVFRGLREVGLKMKPEKRQLMKRKVAYQAVTSYQKKESLRTKAKPVHCESG
ncbi:Retrovirus-related Pol polyprotein from transposon 17.6 [Trichinella patagoniensis]|uniref:Retrovirus-related Pol polyprotein from transposon 17.6 n=1 Tax=Trichinella patagoniensis TaxID=990121 RepID=A0A0V0ZU62_9BILA|nr:Retrovirus-related Pol polyprotein from transposon 17.6 [Trichinella patagoniensis]